MDFGRERPQAERGGGQAPTRGLSALAHLQAEGRAAVKAGRKPACFSLDGRPALRYFGTLCPTSGGRKTGDGGLYTCRRSLKTNGLFVPSRSQKPRPFPCRCKRGANSTAPPLPPSATPAGITHYTLQARSCAKGVPLPPFGNPRFCRSVATVRNPAPVSPPLQNAKKRRRPAQPHGLICAASLFGLRAGTGVLRGLLKCKICVLIMAFCCCVLCRIVV